MSGFISLATGISSKRWLFGTIYKRTLKNMSSYEWLNPLLISQKLISHSKSQVGTGTNKGLWDSLGRRKTITKIAAVVKSAAPKLSFQSHEIRHAV